MKRRKFAKGMKLPKLRTDNGPQFISKIFAEACDKLGIEHERIPVETPNMNAHIEAFHSILEDDCYSRYEFESFFHVYSVVTDYMIYYNERRRHGSIQNMSPRDFHEAFMRNSLVAESIVA